MHPIVAALTFALQAVHVTERPPLDGTMSGSWMQASKASIAWNVDYHRPAENLTDAYVLADDRNLYVLFVAQQKEPIAATQRTDGSGVDNDDHIGLYLWPGGENGFRYFFEANVLGARYQESSENQSFTPPWTATGRKIPGGYAVAVSIPLNALRGDGRATWRLQLDRFVSATEEQNVWASAPAQRFEDQVTYAGRLEGMSFAARLTRTKARLGVYGLGRAGSSLAGGNGFRFGVDAALPVTAGASFVGTFHPDYSNVELNQQTISPTEFQRIFLEVRPFFLQGAKFYNQFSSVNTGEYTAADQVPTLMLYTPNVPTPRAGGAFEGYQGNLGFGVFDALGYGSRNDQAQSLTYANEQQTLMASVQRVGVNYPGFSDVATGANVTYDNLHSGFAYADFAQDSGTAVLDASRAKWFELGGAFRLPESYFGAAFRSIGQYYAPADGYTLNPDITGIVLNGHHFFTFSNASELLSLAVNGTYDLYHNNAGVFDQGDRVVSVSVTTRSLFSATVTAGSDQLLTAQGLYWFNQNGVALGYKDGTSTPVDVSFQGGRFGPGYLHTLLSDAGVQLPDHVLASVQFQHTQFAPDAATPAQSQWLENFSLSWQIDQRSSFSAGVRKLIGSPPPLPAGQPSGPATNLSAAFHRLFDRGEVYLVYGNPNALTTFPSLIIKYIFYAGAAKGT